MFRTTSEASKARREEPEKEEAHPIAMPLLNLTIRTNPFGLEEFTKETQDTVRGINRRNFLLFSAARYPIVSGLADGMYDVNFDLLQYGSADTELQREFQKVLLSTRAVPSDSGKRSRTEILMTLPESKYSVDLLSDVRDASRCTGNYGGTLVQRAHKFDDFLAEHGNMAQSRVLDHFFDPKEIAFLRNARFFYETLIRNASLTHDYFVQMANLSLEGRFADAMPTRMLVGVRGVTDGNDPAILYADKRKNESDEQSRLLYPDESATNALRELLSRNPSWYANPQLKRPIRISALVTEFGNLGSAMRIGQSRGSSSDLAAIATESVTSEVYSALTGKPNGERGNFIDKLRAIASATSSAHYIQPFFEVYNSTANITPAQIRNGAVHARSSSLDGKDRILDVWATLFYQDVAKTLLSVVGGKPRSFLDFDAFAKSYNMVGDTKDACAYVPAEVSKSYENL